MVSLAVATCLSLSVELQSIQQNAVPAAWTTISREVGIVRGSSGRAIGVAVVVDADGLMVSAPGANPPTKVEIVMSGPLTVIANRVGLDAVTGVVAYMPTKWQTGRPFATVATEQPGSNEVLIAATSSGPVTGQAGAPSRAAQLNFSNRYVPVSEVKFERTLDTISGAALFDSHGDLVGLLGATLGDIPVKKAMVPRASRSDGTSAGATGVPMAPMAAESTQSKMLQYGPQGITTAYVLGTPVLARVIEGFRHPSRIVRHPTIGINFKDDAGIVVTRVVPGSGAAKAGLRAGDRIVSLDGERVINSVALASKLFDLTVGSTVKLSFVRRGSTHVVQVGIGG